jgi:hypothetical protein
MSEEFTLRRATVDDIDLLVELRDAMWREIAGEMDIGDVSEALGNTREYFYRQENTCAFWRKCEGAWSASAGW